MAGKKIWHPSYLDYLDGLQRKKFLPEQLQTEGMEQMLNINQFMHSVFNHSIPWIYLLDYTSGKYLMMSKSIRQMLGYDPQYFTEGGVAVISENYEEKHFNLFNKEIFPDRLQILSKIPPAEHPNYIFAYNFQFRSTKGEYLNFLQRNCFIKSDDSGNPLLSFGVITNVNHYKSENPVIQVVEKINQNGFFEDAGMVFKKAYFLNKEDALFTKREKELLLWMAEGLTGKEIADKLFISEYTVNAHRRNMMAKGNAHNVTELVSFAIKNHLL